MYEWIRELFVDHSDLFLRFLNLRWDETRDLVNGMVRVLKDHGIFSGRLLDICCGNGRVPIHMAKKGYRAVGVDISGAFIKDAEKKADENGVSDMVTFFEGDVRQLKKVLGVRSEPFDVIVSAWSSIGYYSKNVDFSIFKQARELSREGSILFVAETMHSEYLSLKFVPAGYQEIGDIVLLESREYDYITSDMKTMWTFYKKSGEDLLFIDRMEFDLHIYTPSELCGLLSKARWETIATYGNLSTLQPRSPLGSLNVVAEAR